MKWRGGWAISKAETRREPGTLRHNRGRRGALMAWMIAGASTVALVLMPVSRVGWAAQESGTFVRGRSGDAVSLDNAIADDGESGEATVQMFDLLVRARPGSTDVEPDLATSWSTSPDGLIWTFKLRQGVKFHD